MLFDLLLVSTIVSTGYVAQTVLRRLGPGQRAYGFMLLGAVALAVAALIARARELGGGVGGLLGTVAIGASIALVMVPPLLRDWGRRAAAADRLRLARALCDLRELFQPGMGARHERELLDTIIAVRGGRVEAAVAALGARRQATAHPVGRRYLDERITLTWLYARRWAEAIAAYEAELGGGGSPQLEVEIVRGYCEVGRLDRAAAVVERLEAASHDEPAFRLLVARARLVFLAFTGRVPAVAAIVGRGGALAGMPDAARRFWIGVARLHAGDREGARQDLEAARASSQARASELAGSMLARLDAPIPTLDPETARIADRLASVRPQRSETTPPPRMSGVPVSRVPVTMALVVANLAVAAWVTWRIGDTGDVGVLLVAGGNLKPATRDGELWRLVSATFLHGGGIHLVVNAYNLWAIGKLVEQLAGPARTLVTYTGAGIAGAAASAWLGSPAPSVGASGAVFGLLGAALADLLIVRARHPGRWARSLIGTLIFVAVAQVAIDFFVPIVDQAAHLGGLAAGIVLGSLGALATRARARVETAPPAGGRAVVRLIQVATGAACATAVAALAYGAWGATDADLGATLQRLPVAERTIDGLALTVPADFEPVAADRLSSRGLAMTLLADRRPGHDATAAVASAREELLTGGARALGFDRVRRLARPTLAVPAPWRSEELDLAVESDLGEQHYRALLFARLAPSGDEVWLGALFYPTAFATAPTAMLATALDSAHAAR